MKIYARIPKANSIDEVVDRIDAFCRRFKMNHIEFQGENEDYGCVAFNSNDLANDLDWGTSDATEYSNYDIIRIGTCKESDVDIRYDNVTLSDFFAKLYKEFHFEPIEFKLTDNYKAVVHKDKIVVGCQEIPFDKALELAKVIERVKNSNKS